MNSISILGRNLAGAWQSMPRRAQLAIGFVTTLALSMLLAGPAGAFAVPAVGSFGYDIYDLVVNQILSGPIGFVGALALIVWGATKLTTNWMLCIMCIIAGTVLIRAAAIVQTLGALT
jgi:hypothetical protein